MSTRPTVRELFERYATVLWRTLSTAAETVANFALRAFEVVIHGLAILAKSLAWLALGGAAVVVALALGAYLIASAIGLSDSPTFQTFRDARLKMNLPPVETTMSTPPATPNAPNPPAEPTAE